MQCANLRLLICAKGKLFLVFHMGSGLEKLKKETHPRGESLGGLKEAEQAALRGRGNLGRESDSRSCRTAGGAES